MASYNYTYSNDFLQQAGIDEEQLRKEIQDALPIVLDFIKFRDNDGDAEIPEDVTITFVAALSAPQVIILNEIIANHIPQQGVFSSEPPVPRKRLYLQGINEPTLVENVYNGTYVLSIFNEQRSSPNTLYTLSKNRDELEPALNRWISIPISGERLDVQWKPTLEIEVTKNITQFDGMYNSNLLVDKSRRQNNRIEDLLLGTSSGDVLDKQFGTEMFICGSDEEDRPNAIFAICKTSPAISSSVTIMSSSRSSVDFTKLDLSWAPYEPIKLNKNTLSPSLDGLYFTDRLRDYKIYEKIFTLTGTDYIELKGEDDVTVFKYKQRFTGFILIEGTEDGMPCGIFSVGKNTKDQLQAFNRIVSGNGRFTGERLELIWPVDENIQVRKNGTGYNGLYRFTAII